MIVWRIEGKKKNSIYLKYIFLQDLMQQMDSKTVHNNNSVFSS